MKCEFVLTAQFHELLNKNSALSNSLKNAYKCIFSYVSKINITIRRAKYI
jgi:hypothetical protein